MILKLSNKMKLAIAVVIDISYNAKGYVAKTCEIAQRNNVSNRYLEKIMQSLTKSNILKSIRGKNGGYYIEKKRSDINIADIIISINSLEKKENVENDVFKFILEDINNKIINDLKKITLDKILENKATIKDYI